MGLEVRQEEFISNQQSGSVLTRTSGRGAFGACRTQSRLSNEPGYGDSLGIRRRLEIVQFVLIERHREPRHERARDFQGLRVILPVGECAPLPLDMLGE